MPVYSLSTPNTLTTERKKALVNLVTDTHCSVMIAPEQFVHVLFSDGITLTDNKQLYVHANVRQGRSQEQIDRMCTELTKGCASILTVSDDQIHINLLEIAAKWAMEGGYVMPDPGEENEWMAKVTDALKARKGAEVL